MDGLLKLPYELQIVLVAGYLAYKIATIGKGRLHRTEDFLLQVLTFGVVARSLGAALAWIFSYRSLLTIETYETVQLAEAVLLTCALAILLGMFWRAYGERAARRVMNATGVYRDDHESSVWQSIVNERANWTYVQIHLASGRILEASFGEMKPSPKVPILINDDGVGTYVTRSYDVDNNETEHDLLGKDGEHIFTYIPRLEIKQMDIGWHVQSVTDEEASASHQNQS